MSLKHLGVIEIPDSAATLFDHGAFDPKSRRLFVAHTARDRVEVIDHDTGRHLVTLNDFPEAAGVVADEGHVLVTNRGAASLAWLDAHTLETRLIHVRACSTRADRVPSGQLLTSYDVKPIRGDKSIDQHQNSPVRRREDNSRQLWAPKHVVLPSR